MHLRLRRRKPPPGRTGAPSQAAKRCKALILNGLVVSGTGHLCAPELAADVQLLLRTSPWRVPLC